MVVILSIGQKERPKDTDSKPVKFPTWSECREAFRNIFTSPLRAEDNPMAITWMRRTAENMLEKMEPLAIQRQEKEAVLTEELIEIVDKIVCQGRAEGWDISNLTSRFIDLSHFRDGIGRKSPDMEIRNTEHAANILKEFIIQGKSLLKVWKIHEAGSSAYLEGWIAVAESVLDSKLEIPISSNLDFAEGAMARNQRTLMAIAQACVPKMIDAGMDVPG